MGEFWNELIFNLEFNSMVEQKLVFFLLEMSKLKGIELEEFIRSFHYFKIHSLTKG